MLEAAARAPNALALVDRASALTYGELAELAVRASRRLRGAGVQRESIVAIAAPAGPHLVVAQLATWLAGGAYMPLNPSYPQARLELMLEDARPTVLLDFVGVDFGGPNTREEAHAPRPPRWSLERTFAPLSQAEDTALPSHWEQTEPTDLAYLLYTSGSTGRPKGVLIEHASLLNYITWDARTFGLGPDDRVSQTIAPSFDMSVWEIWPTLIAGASLHFANRADYARPGALYRWLAEEQITVCVLATPLAEHLLKEPVPDRLALRAMLVAGERLRSFAGTDKPFALFNLYGPTEATINVTCGRVPERAPELRALPTLGRAIAGAELHILDEHGRDVAPGQPGELYIGGPGLARGYHNLPQLTRERFVDDLRPGQRLYRTGDLVRLCDNGELAFLGRLDHQIKIRGHRIELGEIEAVLAGHPDVKSVIVLAESGRLCAYVVARRSGSALEATTLRRFLESRLPAYMVPSAYVRLDRLPLTPHGKIDRESLRARIGPQAVQVDTPDTGPRQESFQGRLMQLWREALGVEEITGASDYFELGGHSLTALALVSRIEEHFSVPVGLSDLVAAPTFAAFCQRVATRRHEPHALKEGTDAAAEDVGAGPAPFPLTDVQYAYWVGRQGVLPLGDVATHLYFEREGCLNVVRLQDALNRVVHHHGMLRAVVRDDGSQEILQDVPTYAITVYDHTRTDEDVRERHLAAVREELSHQVLPAATCGSIATGCRG